MSFKCINVEPAELPFVDVKKVCYLSPVDGITDWAMIWARQKDAPWLVCIHGHGSNGDQLFTRPDIRDFRLKRYIEMGFNILSPNLRGNAWMSPDAAVDMHALLDFTRSEYHAERFVFVSGSMGGTSNLIYSVLHPEDVAAVAALCSATDIARYYRWCLRQEPKIIAEIAEAIASAYGASLVDCPGMFERHIAVDHVERLTMPVFIAHGTADKIIPVEESRRLAERMTGLGNFVYEEMPDGDHDAPLRCEPMLKWLKICV